MTTAQQIARLDRMISKLILQDESIRRSAIDMHHAALSRVNARLDELLFRRLSLETRRDSGTYELLPEDAV